MEANSCALVLICISLVTCEHLFIDLFIICIFSVNHLFTCLAHYLYWVLYLFYWFTAALYILWMWILCVSHIYIYISTYLLWGNILSLNLEAWINKILSHMVLWVDWTQLWGFLVQRLSCSYSQAATGTRVIQRFDWWWSKNVSTCGGSWSYLSLKALLGAQLWLLAAVSACGFSMWFGLLQHNSLFLNVSIPRDRMQNCQPLKSWV